MIYAKFHPSNESMRKVSAMEIANCLISLKSIAKSDIAEYAKISVMSAAKATNALFECGITNEHELNHSKTHHKSTHISLSYTNKFLILDLLPSTWRMCCISCDYKEHAHFTYKPSYTFDIWENLNIFMGQGYAALSNSIKKYRGVCVMLDKDKINEDIFLTVFKKTFNHLPNCIIGIEEVINEIKGINIYKALPNDKIFYLNIGNLDTSYFITQDFNFKCNIKRLILKDKRTFGEAIESSISSQEIMEVLFEVFNSAIALFDPNVCILESDRVVFGHQPIAKIRQMLTPKNLREPAVFVNSAYPKVYTMAALAYLVKMIIVKILINEY